MRVCNQLPNILHISLTTKGIEVITILREIDVLKTIGDDIGQCCSNKPIYETTYSLGTRWFVCNECIEIECFNSDIKEKVRIQHAIV